VTLQAQILELLRRLRKETGMALWLITHDFGTVAEVADRIAVMRGGVLVETSGPEFFDGPQHSYSRALLNAMPRLEACLQRKPLVKMNSASSPPLLDVRDFRVYYPIKRGIFQRTVDHVRAVDGVSFRLERGETLALVGESGCGKTTLGKALLNLVPATSGEVLLDGVKISGQKVGARHEVQADLQIVFQDPYSSMNPRMLVGNILEEGLRAQRLRMTPAERRDKVEALLLAVGLPVSARGRYPHEFSGGQRQRLCIARALAVEPRLVICDEPTSALDVSVQAQVIRLLRELQDRHGLSYLFITHDLAVVSELADRVAVMHSGKMVETGTTRQVLFNAENDYTRGLLAALPKLHKSGRTHF
jgi:ABC-type microcin C transport system duplicated ATPase subunit YejF